MMRMLTRVSKGRAIIHAFDFNPEANIYLLHSKEEQKGEIKLAKSIFFIIFQTSDGNILQNKLIKVCDLFNASRYKIPEKNELNQALQKINLDIKEQDRILTESKYSSLNFINSRTGVVSI